MAITYSLAADPFWFAVNLTGTAAGGAQMFTKRSLNKVQDKAVFMDPGGTVPWENPVPFDLNGVQGRYFSKDTSSFDLNDWVSIGGTTTTWGLIGRGAYGPTQAIGIAAAKVFLIWLTLWSIRRTKRTKIVSNAATAITTTIPKMFARRQSCSTLLSMS